MARVRHRQRRRVLNMYYGVGEESGKSTVIDYSDINDAHFKPEVYLEKNFQREVLERLDGKRSRCIET